VGTLVAEGKVTIEPDRRTFLLEPALKPVFSFVRAQRADTQSPGDHAGESSFREIPPWSPRSLAIAFRSSALPVPRACWT
jgi:hypothetical protein